MNILLEPFNPLEVAPEQGGGKSFPVGKHPVVAVASEIRATKDNSGGMLVFALEVIDGPAKGFVGDHRLNLYNQDPTAVKIARGQLSSLCHVTGVFNLGPQGTDTSLLHRIPFIIEVAPQKDPQYTEIKKVYDINGNEPGKQGQQQQAQPQAQNFQQQQPQQNHVQQPAAGGWGGAANTAPANTGFAQQQPQQAQPQQQQPAAASWQQNGGAVANTAAPAGGKPAWAN